MRLLFVVAIVKVAIGIVVSLWVLRPAVTAPALPTWYYTFLLLAFGLSAAWLHFGGRRDPRARMLAALFALFATLFTDSVALRAAPSMSAPLEQALETLATVHLIAFCPYAFWRFAWSFPRVQPSLLGERAAKAVEYLALSVAIVLVSGNVIAALPAVHSSPFGDALGELSPDDDFIFWQAVTGLTLAPLALLILKLGRATLVERRRLKWIVAGIAVGNLPMLAHVFLAVTSGSYRAFASDPEVSRALGIALTAFALLIPLSAAYAVLVDAVLDVSFVVRQAVQYGLARFTVGMVIAVLIVAAAVVAYENRASPLDDLFARSPLTIGVIVLLGLVLFWRRALLRAIDRRFFRDQYDARKILVDLVEHSQSLASVRDLNRLLVAEVDRALHLERVALLLIDQSGERLSDPDDRIRALELGGPLTTLLSGSPAPLDVDPSAAGSALSRLPENERDWLIDAGARLLVPLFGARGTAIGLLVLGDKRSELPFTQDDKRLMTAVAASAALALEQKLSRESPDLDTPGFGSRSRAAQCGVCGRVRPTAEQHCATCGGPMREALLPLVLAGKFEVERQIGAGGMGVVYLGRDLHLNRPIAMKVLPRVVTAAAARLRREARAMAGMQHPHLAVIHAMESWRGAPVLILEYLAGGTLAARIRQGQLPVDDVLSMSIAMAEVLRHVHTAGYLHRDVKPSNIGYTFDGRPKLLDFGLAQMIADASTATSTQSLQTTAPTVIDLPTADAPSDAGRRQFVGTPAYMPPEMFTSGPITPALDVWGLAVTMYEALTGTHPFRAATLADTARLILTRSVEDARLLRPDCPPAIADFLATALSKDLHHRPQTAAEFLNRLTAARIALPLSPR